MCVTEGFGIFTAGSGIKPKSPLQTELMVHGLIWFPQPPTPDAVEKRCESLQ